MRIDQGALTRYIPKNFRDYVNGTAYRCDRLGKLCTSYAGGPDPVSGAALLEDGFPLDRAPEVAAAYALGGWEAVRGVLESLVDSGSRHPRRLTGGIRAPKLPPVAAPAV